MGMGKSFIPRRPYCEAADCLEISVAWSTDGKYCAHCEELLFNDIPPTEEVCADEEPVQPIEIPEDEDDIEEPDARSAALPVQIITMGESNSFRLDEFDEVRIVGVKRGRKTMIDLTGNPAKRRKIIIVE